jgi:hypothetical protein
VLAAAAEDEEEEEEEDAEEEAVEVEPSKPVLTRTGVLDIGLALVEEEEEEEVVVVVVVLAVEVGVVHNDGMTMDDGARVGYVAPTRMLSVKAGL